MESDLRVEAGDLLELRASKNVFFKFLNVDGDCFVFSNRRILNIHFLKVLQRKIILVDTAKRDMIFNCFFQNTGLEFMWPSFESQFLDY